VSLAKAKPVPICGSPHFFKGRFLSRRDGKCLFFEDLIFEKEEKIKIWGAIKVPSHFENSDKREFILLGLGQGVRLSQGWFS
jgi:hypothetical protein